MHAALDDTEIDAMVWMPAHTTEADVGRSYLGNGSRLTHMDRKGNDEADRLVKLTVEAHRVPKQVRDMVKELHLVVEKTARWVAKATYAGGHQTVKPFRDTDASRAAAVAASRLKAPRGRTKLVRRGKEMTVQPVALGARGGAKSAKEKAKRTPRWPARAATAWRRRGRHKGHNNADVDVWRFLARDSRPQVHAVTAAERKAALLKRVPAKEASGRAAALAGANDLGEGSKRHKSDK
jgi:hypothetical protein